MGNPKIYFPNLNGLRFIAAFLVIVHHIEQFKLIFNLDNYWGVLPFVGMVGKLGVFLFFVLSGFLITYLLLAEEHAFKKISIGKFYMRRIIRIWPLYFLIIMLAFFVLPNIDLFTLPGYGKDEVYSDLLLKLFLYAIFFPNLVMTLTGFVPYASHIWTIGTEEQFYFVWPLALKYFVKYRLVLMLFIKVFYLVLVALLATEYTDFLPYKNVISVFVSSFKIDCLAIGAICAILLFQKSKSLNVLLNNYLFYSTIIVTMYLILKGVCFTYLHDEIYSVLFGIIILNFAANDKIKISLENRVLNYLGNISYGLYMYHSIGIVLTLAICTSMNLSTNWIIYPLCFLITITMAGLSYKYYETFFLKFKSKFSKITSGSESQTSVEGNYKE